MRLLAALALALATSAAAQARPAVGVIDAIVTDTTLAPLADAAVSLVGTGVRVTTGGNGRLLILSVPTGRRQLVIQRLGYRPLLADVDVTAGDTVRLSFALQNATRVLEGMTVTATGRSLRMAEFEKRRENNVGGQFLTAAEIEKRNTVFATELIRTFMGLKVKPQASAYFAVSARGDGFGGVARPGKPPILGCPVEVHVDGVRMTTPFDLDQLPSPKDLAGIEFYTGPASTPLQFGGENRRCGVLMVWTKDGSEAPAP